jgi:hypothetical protein
LGPWLAVACSFGSAVWLLHVLLRPRELETLAAPCSRSGASVTEHLLKESMVDSEASET